MSNFDTNKIYAKTSASLARERFLLGEQRQIQIEAETITGYVVEIRHGHSATELLKDCYQQINVLPVVLPETFSAKISPWTRRRFEMLSEQWKKETFALSSVSEIVSHPSYQKIIGMGPEALPLIFEDLSNTGSKWYWSLISITGENPVPPEDRGFIEKMNEAWLEWGSMQGYV